MAQVYTFTQVGWQVRMLHRCSIHFLCYRMISQLFNCYFWNYFSMYVYMNLCVISEVVSLLLNFVTLTMNDTITTLASLHGGSWFEAVQLTGIRAVASSIEKNYRIISTSNCRREPDFDNNVTQIQNEAVQCYTEQFTYQNEKASVLVICIWIKSKYLISCPIPIWNDLIPFPRCRSDHDFSIDLLRHISRKKEVHL